MKRVRMRHKPYKVNGGLIYKDTIISLGNIFIHEYLHEEKRCEWRDRRIGEMHSKAVSVLFNHLKLMALKERL